MQADVRKGGRERERGGEGGGRSRERGGTSREKRGRGREGGGGFCVHVHVHCAGYSDLSSVVLATVTSALWCWLQ